jgi:hypothetical protein
VSLTHRFKVSWDWPARIANPVSERVANSWFYPDMWKIQLCCGPHRDILLIYTDISEYGAGLTHIQRDAAAGKPINGV